MRGVHLGPEAYEQDQKYQKDKQRLKGFNKLEEKLRFSNQEGSNH